MVRQVTLKQVAARAGVSYQTVSKVLNDRIQVSDETAVRIWEAVRELGYRPNQMARNLRMQSSQLIGYSWAPSTRDKPNPILDQFLQSMVHASYQAGYHLLCFPFPEDERRVEGYRELIDTNQVDGFVISGVEYEDPRILFLQERGFPFVAFGRSNPEWRFPYVDVDGQAGIAQAVEHLIKLGHRRIGVLAWPEQSRVGRDRLNGYFNAMAAASLPIQATWVRRGEGSVAFGREGTMTLLELPEEQRPTAIVCLNDVMAIGAMELAQGQGYRIGENLAITGFDDYPIVQYLNPPLTSVHQPIWEIGLRVIDLLVKVINSRTGDENEILMTPRLVIRASSAGYLAANP